ncbi:MAG: DUF2017 family protein [Flaviflexus sp.]|nr:DUF2017 family protein [Flaviflexus sp.]
MQGFVRTRTGVRSAGAPGEFRLISSLLGDIIELLGGETEPGDDPLARLEAELAPAAQPTDDPAVARLLPDMSEDPDQAEELRALTESTIRQAKVAHCALVRDQLAAAGEVLTIAEADIPAWLAALNDLRLVLASRLDIIDTEDADRVTRRAHAYAAGERAEDGDEVTRELTVLYAMMGWWQDSLLQAVRFSRPAG